MTQNKEIMSNSENNKLYDLNTCQAFIKKPNAIILLINTNIRNNFFLDIMINMSATTIIMDPITNGFHALSNVNADKP